MLHQTGPTSTCKVLSYGVSAASHTSSCWMHVSYFSCSCKCSWACWSLRTADEQLADAACAAASSASCFLTGRYAADAISRLAHQRSQHGHGT